MHLPLDVAALHSALAKPGRTVRLAHSACPDRAAYLQRPDLGRQLDAQSCEALAAAAPPACELALVVADGLSALAIAQHGAPFIDALLDRLVPSGWSTPPVVIVQQGRVAIGDQVGAILNARCVVVLIGERPGLSSPDSMGLYLTFNPGPGLTDASRNCISNVRLAGLGFEAAAYKLHYLLDQARLRGLSGVALKDDTDAPALAEPANNFLIHFN